MKILNVAQTYYPYIVGGGFSTKVRGIATTLARRGHEVIVLTADLGPLPPDGNLEILERGRSGCRAAHDGVEAVYLPTWLRYRTLTLNPAVVSFCFRRLRAFDVVHLFGLYDFIGPTVAKFCRAWGIPYVVEPMGMYRPILRSLHKKRLYHRLLGRSLAGGAARLIATSEQEQHELIEEGLRAEKILLRRNGVDLAEFACLPSRGEFRKSLGLSGNEELILFIGRLAFIKGVDVLVQAFAGLSRTARLVIAGPDFGDGCAQAIRVLRDSLKIGDRVSFLGPVHGQEKLQALRDADVVVLPSRYESFGNVAAEAIACGTPVILTRRCGIAPLVDGRAGLVVECEVEALRAGVSRFLADPGLRDQLRSGCSAVAQALSWEEPVSLMEGVYSEICGRTLRG